MGPYVTQRKHVKIPGGQKNGMGNNNNNNSVLALGPDGPFITSITVNMIILGEHNALGEKYLNYMVKFWAKGEFEKKKSYVSHLMENGEERKSELYEARCWQVSNKVITHQQVLLA